MLDGKELDIWIGRSAWKRNDEQLTSRIVSGLLIFSAIVALSRSILLANASASSSSDTSSSKLPRIDLVVGNQVDLTSKGMRHKITRKAVRKLNVSLMVIMGWGLFEPPRGIGQRQRKFDGSNAQFSR